MHLAVSPSLPSKERSAKLQNYSYNMIECNKEDDTADKDTEQGEVRQNLTKHV